MGHGGGPNVCATTPSLGNVGGGSSSAPTGASCAPADFGRQTLSPSEVDKRSGKRKSDSSGKREEYEKKKLHLHFYFRMCTTVIPVNT